MQSCAIYRKYGPSFDADLKAFKKASRMLHQACADAAADKELDRFCGWYAMEDMEYEATIDDGNGYPAPVHYKTL